MPAGPASETARRAIASARHRVALLRRVIPAVTRGPREAAWFLGVALLVMVRRVVPVGRGVALPLPLWFAGERHVWRVADHSELLVLEEVLLDGQYALEVEHPVRMVMDLGANVGFSVLALRAQFPDARVLAVEADPGTAERLRRNVGGLPGVGVVQAAASAADGEVTFARSRASWASSIGDATGEGAERIRVPARSVPSLMAEHGIDRVDVLKVDVEGAEADVVRGFGDELSSRVRTVIGEYHDFIPGLEGRPEAFFELLAPLEVEHRRGGMDWVFVARSPGGEPRDRPTGPG